MSALRWIKSNEQWKQQSSLTCQLSAIESYRNNSSAEISFSREPVGKTAFYFLWSDRINRKRINENKSIEFARSFAKIILYHQWQQLCATAISHLFAILNGRLTLTRWLSLWAISRYEAAVGSSHNEPGDGSQCHCESKVPPNVKISFKLAELQFFSSALVTSRKSSTIRCYALKMSCQEWRFVFFASQSMCWIAWEMWLKKTYMITNRCECENRTNYKYYFTKKLVGA